MGQLITLDRSNIETNLTDHVLMLDTTKSQRFQCGGFFVNRNSPICIVTNQAQQASLKEALKSGVLMDITGKDYSASGVIGAISKAEKEGVLTADAINEQVGQPVLIGKDDQGRSYVIVPKDEEEYKAIQQELATNGFLRRPAPVTNTVHGLTSVFEEDLQLISAFEEELQ